MRFGSISSTVSLAAAIAFVVAGLAAPEAQCAVGVPFATADFNGTNGGQTYFTVSGAVQVAQHDNVVERVTIISGRLELDGGGAGAVHWWPYGTVAAGAAPSFSTRCETADDACAFHVDWFDAADIPATISGVITSGTDGESSLVFASALGGTYRVRVTLGSGSLLVEHGQCNQGTSSPVNIPTSGTYLLGSYASGQQAICVHAPDGVAATWAMQIVKDPAIITGLTVTPAHFRQSFTANDQFHFQIDNPANVEAWVTDATGATVVVLGPTTGLPTPAGLRVLPFGGIDPGGSLLPDGTYVLHVAVVGDTGSHDQATVILDSTGPSISVPAPRVSTARGTVSVHLSDAGGAVASASVTVRKGSTSYTTTYTSIHDGLLTFKPSHDWTVGGKNELLISAKDSLENTSQRKWFVTYTPPHVDRAWISLKALGAATRALPRGTRALFASFHFDRPPRAGSVTTTWYEPDGHATPTVSKNRATLVRAFVKSDAALPHGRWRCVLRVNGVETSEASVRVG